MAALEPTNGKCRVCNTKVLQSQRPKESVRLNAESLKQLEEMEDKKFSKVNGRRVTNDSADIDDDGNVKDVIKKKKKKEDSKNYWREEEEKSPDKDSDKLKISFQDSNRRKLSVHKISKPSGKPFISFGHDNWNLVLHMIFGVSKSVRNAIYEEEFHIVDDDFSRKYKYELI